MDERSTFEKMRAEERRSRKKLIVDAAMELFAKRPVNQIGMRDIAKQAGISAAAIYRYFASRDDILVEALIRHIRIVERQMEQLVAGGNTTLEALCLASADFLMDNESLFQMMGHFMITGKINERALEKFNTVQRYFLRMLDRINTQAGVGEGNRLFSHALYASVVGVVMAFRNYPGRSQKEIRRHIHRLTVMVSDVFSTGTISDPDHQPLREFNVGHPDERPGVIVAPAAAGDKCC